MDIASMLAGMNNLGGAAPLPPAPQPSVNQAIALMGTLEGGGKDKVKKPAPLSDDQLNIFGNFGGSADVKVKARYLASKGLRGADQMINDQPDISTREGIVNSQADWKTSAFSTMLIRARKLGLQTPTEITANKDALLGSLPDRLKDAMNNPFFNQIHPNYWQVFGSVLQDQYGEEAKRDTKNSIVKK